jgi:hypothetical protein
VKTVFLVVVLAAALGAGAPEVHHADRATLYAIGCLPLVNAQPTAPVRVFVGNPFTNAWTPTPASVSPHAGGDFLIRLDVAPGHRYVRVQQGSCGARARFEKFEKVPVDLSLQLRPGDDSAMQYLDERDTVVYGTLPDMFIKDVELDHFLDNHAAFGLGDARVVGNTYDIEGVRSSWVSGDYELEIDLDSGRLCFLPITIPNGLSWIVHRDLTMADVRKCVEDAETPTP